MSRLAPCLAVALTCALGAAPAAAQESNGLYEPFPSGISKERAKRFLERLPSEGRRLVTHVSEGDLDRGVFVGAGLEAAGGGTASERGGLSAEGSSLAWPLQLALLVLPLVTGFGVALRRR